MRPPSQQRLNEIWDRYAPGYDKSMRRTERLFFGDARQWACALASGEVLEVAAGTGLNLPHYPAGIKLTGVEASQGMLAIARRRAAELGIDADLRQADARELPFGDASFDTVICTLALCCIPDDRAAIGQMRRVLRPGGRLILLDHVASDNRVVLAAERLIERLFMSSSGEYLTRRPLPLVEEAGLRIERSQRTRLGVVERLLAIKP